MDEILHFQIIANLNVIRALNQYTLTEPFIILLLNVSELSRHLELDFFQTLSLLQSDYLKPFFGSFNLVDLGVTYRI